MTCGPDKLTIFISPFLSFASTVETFDDLLRQHVQTEYVKEK